MTAGGSGADIYYHCFVKVCPIANEATCSKKLVSQKVKTLGDRKIKLDGVTNTDCSSIATVSDPTRKRRESSSTQGIGAHLTFEYQK